MARRRLVRPNQPATVGENRSTGAAPGRKCGAKTKNCTCSPPNDPKGKRRHHMKMHVGKKGACTVPECPCQRFEYRICTAPAMANGRCAKHGGKALNGMAVPSYRHGGTSRYLSRLTGDMAQAYERAVGDPELSNLTAELALTEARIDQVLSRLDTGGVQRFTEIATAFAEFEEQAKRGNLMGANAASTKLRSLLASGSASAAAAVELTALVDQKRLLATSHARILRDTGQTIALGAMTVVMAQVADILRRHVLDAKILSAVVGDISRLLGPGAAPTPPAGSGSPRRTGDRTHG